MFAFDEFDGDEHEDEVDQCEGGESGEEGDAGLAAGAEFDETAEEHNDDADENHDDGFDADGFAAEAAGVGRVGRDIESAGMKWGSRGGGSRRCGARRGFAAEGLAHEGDVFLSGGEVAFDPAGALGDGLAEAGGLLVVEDSGGDVGGGETVEGGVEGEFVVFGQAMEGPAAPFFDELAVDVEAGAGEDNVAAAAGAFLVADGVDHGESESADGGDDVFVGVFRGAVAGGELVASAVRGEDFFEIVGGEAVVGVENEIGVVGFVLREDLF